jgi:hypothetical protein
MAGFAHQQIENPDAHYRGKAPTIAAIVAVLSATRRILKVRLPGDRVGYQLQRCGRYAFAKGQKEPEWLHDLNFSIPDPAFAVQYFQSQLADVLGMGSRIIEVTDSKEQLLPARLTPSPGMES